MTVGDYTWICMGASVVNNVRVGVGAIVAAGAAVIKDVCDGVLVTGVPTSVCFKKAKDTKRKFFSKIITPLSMVW